MTYPILNSGGSSHNSLTDVGTNSHTQLDSHVTNQSNVLNVAYPNRNLIINGNFLINQRAWVLTSTAITAGTYMVDRWKGSTTSGSIVFTVTNNETVVTVPTGGFEQIIEGLNIQSGTHVISFTATGDTVCTVDGTTRANGDTFTLTGGTNATVKFSSAGGAGTVKLVQVEAGSVVTPFEHGDYGRELLLCQRYLITWTPTRFLLGAYSGGSILPRNFYSFKVSMRISPSVDTSGVTWTTGSGWTIPTFGGINSGGVEVVGSTVIPAGSNSWIRASGVILFNGEI